MSETIEDRDDRQAAEAWAVLQAWPKRLCYTGAHRRSRIAAVGEAEIGADGGPLWLPMCDHCLAGYSGQGIPTRRFGPDEWVSPESEIEALRDLLGLATEFTVSVLPDGHVDQPTFAVTVNYTGRGLWAIRNLSRCWNGDERDWVWEPSPSNRDDDFFAACRFTRDDALRIADEIAHAVRWNGVTAGEIASRPAASPAAPETTEGSLG